MKNIKYVLFLSFILVFAFVFSQVGFTNNVLAQVVNCPIGYICIPIPAQPANCPVGYTCKPINPIPVTPPTASSTCYTFLNNLQVGNTGPDVTALQLLLRSRGYYPPVNGSFDDDTLAAVRAFQTSYGIPATGFVGPLTRASINASCGNTVIQPTQPSVDLATIGGANILIDPSLTSTSNIIFVARITGGSGQYRYYWNFGDGNRSDGTVLQGSRDDMGHRYANPGTYNATVYVVDSNGQRSTTEAMTITARLISSIPTSSSITISTPNGGETWKTGSIQTIRWNVGDSSIKTVDFNLRDSRDNSGYDLYLGAPNTGSLTFPLRSDYRSGTYFLQIGKLGNPFIVYDESDYPFTIGTPIIQSTTISESVRCVFNGSNNQERCWGDLPSQEVGNPTHFNCSGNNYCSVAVNGRRNGPITWGSSCGGSANTIIDGNNENANFSCSSISNQPSITVSTPNGGETLTMGSNYLINWSSPKSGDFKVDIKLSSENRDFLIIQNYTGNSYNWIIGSILEKLILPVGQYKIKVCESGTNNCDSSNSSFNLVSNSKSTSIVTPTDKQTSSIFDAIKNLFGIGK